MKTDPSDFSDVSIELPLENGVILIRVTNEVSTNVPHLVVHHSPTGFEFGYAGSGPADLALNICEAALNAIGHTGQRTDCYDGDCWQAAWEMHQNFKREYLANLPREGAVIPWPTVIAWVKMYFVGLEDEQALDLIRAANTPFLSVADLPLA